ncbi:Putative ribonuclease H protein At1g65750, partial [Linum perenne]
RSLAIQVDSRCVINILTDTSNSSHQHSSLVTLFQRLRARHWEVQLCHVYREANYLANALANHSHSLAPGTHILTLILISADTGKVMMLEEFRSGV